MEYHPYYLATYLGFCAFNIITILYNIRKLKLRHIFFDTIINALLTQGNNIKEEIEKFKQEDNKKFDFHRILFYIVLGPIFSLYTILSSIWKRYKFIKDIKKEQEITKEYVDLCKKYNEEPEKDTLGINPYTDHAKMLKEKDKQNVLD
jgi:hypothetical protein